MKLLGLTISGIAIVAMILVGVTATQSTAAPGIQLLASADMGNFVGVGQCKPATPNGPTCQTCYTIDAFTSMKSTVQGVTTVCIQGYGAACTMTGWVNCGRSGNPQPTDYWDGNNTCQGTEDGTRDDYYTLDDASAANYCGSGG